MKIKSRKIVSKDFVRIAYKCFWPFVIIEIAILISETFITILGENCLSLLFEQHYIKLRIYFYIFINTVIKLYFVFAYPLVILEYFSGTKLKPIKTSIDLIVDQASKVKFIYFITGFQILISFFYVYITENPSENKINIFMLLISWILSFLIIIYSYIRLSEYFYKDIILNFDEHSA